MKSIVKLLPSVFGFLMCTHITFSQLFIENKTNHAMKVAFAYFQTGTNYTGWISQGWLTIEPHQKVEALHYNPTGKRLYIYAQSEEKELKGSNPIQVLKDRTKSFRLKNSMEKPSIDTIESLPFIEIKRGLSRAFKNKETIELI